MPGKINKAGRKPTGPPPARNSLGSRIRAKRIERGLSLDALAEMAETTNQTLSRIELGRSSPNDQRTKRTITLIARALADDFGERWLWEYARGPRQIPVEARVAAGQPIDYVEIGESVTVDERIIHTAGDICALRVTGNSMVEDHILNGDILICKRTAQPRKDSVVVVDFKGGIGAAVKRWRRKEDTVILSSDHFDPNSPKYEYPAWRLGKVYEVVGLIRSLQ